MNPNSQHEESLFNEAVQLPTPEARAAFLREACAGDDQLRQRVEALIAAAQPTNDFLEAPPPGARTLLSASPGAAGSPSPPPEEKAGERRPPTPTPPSATIQVCLESLPVSEKPGDRIGHYKLLQQIGEGGCGVVYMAEQTEPIRRRVAFKVIKLGMDTKSVVARFEAERQALALMDHLNIAKVLDAGATDTGRPYFVMELVKGIKITDYCDQNKLSTKERLDLFIQVCHAIQHAHQKGIIHRDIKPSNVLVCSHDGVPVPKVIDFGIAKATQQPLTDKTVFTAFGQFIGTPAYMSPEQAELSGLDIDTRTDIYALGVLLYELLTGKPPFEPETLMKAGLDEMRRIIRETEPPKPSTKLATACAATPHSALRIPKLKEVRGDLDWIVMKCLEKDRRRRYETAVGLAHDIERHLNSEPVTAAAPSVAYRVGKFVRRHRYGFATAATITVLLVGGAVVSTWQMARAKRAGKQAETVASFLEDMLTGVKPEEAKGRDTKLMLEIVDKAAARMEKDLKDQPRIQAQLKSTLGGVYSSLGQYSKAEPLLQQALRVQENSLGADQLATLVSVIRLGNVLLDKGDAAGAEPLLRRALELSERTLGKEHRHTMGSMNNLANLLSTKGDLAGAEALRWRALETQERTLGKEHRDTLTSLHNLANSLFLKGDYSGAEPLYRRALEAQERTLGKEHPDALRSVNSLAGLLTKGGNYAEAERLFRRALEASERILGKDHPYTLQSLHGLAGLLQEKGDYAGAERLSRQAWEARERTLGDDHPGTLSSLNNLAALLVQKGDHAKAEPLFMRVLEVRERTLDKEHPDTPNSMNNLATLLKIKGDYTRAESLYRQALDIQERRLGNEHAETLASMHNLADCLLKKGDCAGAKQLFRRVLEVRERRLGREHADTWESVNGLAMLLSMEGNEAEAEPLYRRALEARERLLPKDHPDTLMSMNNLGALLSNMGDYAGAEPLLRRALEARERVLPKGHPDTLMSIRNLAKTLWKKGDYAEAEVFYRRALEGMERMLGKGHPDTIKSRETLVGVLTTLGKTAEADALMRGESEQGGRSSSHR